MKKPILRIENLSKQYRIGAPQAVYTTLRDSLARTFRAPLKRLSRKPGSTIWALKDVSLEVMPGEVIGIIGRNGAGKSTLLKILSGITEPTTGQVELYGRVGSLLEVGTGFHAELTGRENVYLNGAILGMRKAEIKRKFDEIIAFAEAQKFIDTPVKHYSTGMYFRLAFAVAAHLEPEILLVDEVLAVGDTAFQKKCLGKMDDVAKGWRTVLFVSHQMNQIRRLCKRCIWLDAGLIRKAGSALEVISAYEAALTSLPVKISGNSDDKNVAARFVKWEIIEPRQEQPNVLVTMGPVTVGFILKVNSPISNGAHSVFLINSDNQVIWATDARNLELNAGIQEFVYTLPSLPLRPGVYYWQVNLYKEHRLVDFWNCVPEMIIGTEPITHPQDAWQGILNLPWKFYVKRLE